jgi:hypothetical protein
MIRSAAIALLVSALALGACAYQEEGPPPPAPGPVAAPPPPPPPPAAAPGAFALNGTVVDRRGRCHTIAGENGVRYAVDPKVLGRIPAGARVRFEAQVEPRLTCPGAQRVRVLWIRRIG